jgi:hypothetical protein
MKISRKKIRKMPFNLRKRAKSFFTKGKLKIKRNRKSEIN